MQATPHNPPQLSLCMIVRDSASTLAACLTSIRPWVDEIIVVDTGSQDNTPEIARQHGARVSHFPWVDSFARARNESLRLALGEWLFWMDADDVIDERNGRGLSQLVRRPHDPRTFGYIVQVHCPDTRGDDDITVVDHVKLFRNHPAIRFEHRIHEQVLMPIRRLGGDIAWTDLFVEHANADRTPTGRLRKCQRDLRLLELDLQDHPDHPFVLFNFGMTYNDMGEHALAVEWLERSIRASQGSESHVRKTFALLVHSRTELGQLTQALEACRRGLQLFPQDAELHFRAGILLHQSGQLNEAVIAYQAVLRGGEERHLTSRCQSLTGYKARHNLALVYRDLGDLAREELQWRLILDEKPQYRAAWSSLSETLLRNRKFAAADVQVDRMLSASQLRGIGLMAKAEIALLGGDKSQAVLLCKQATSEFPDDVDVMHSQCRLLFACAAWDDAERALTKLTQWRPNDGAAWHNLGLVRHQQGDDHRAVAALEQSLAVRPASAATRDLLRDILAPIQV